MIKNKTFLSAILEKLVRITYLWNDTFCILFFGEPDIDIPEE